jgi:hypothetical protein
VSNVTTNYFRRNYILQTNYHKVNHFYNRLKPLRFITILIIITGLSVFAETSLSGKIGGMTLDTAGSPYLISGDIVVDKGTFLTLKPGCVLLFRPFTGLRVDGSLIVDGSNEKPVVFTSSRDSKYYDSANIQPQAFDWNGITITKSARRVKLFNFILCYSVYGIKAQTERVSISNGNFYSNGQFNVTINEKIQNVTDNFPFFYHTDDFTDAENKSSHSRFIAPILVGIAGLGAAGMATYFFIDKSTIHHDYLKQTDPQGASSFHTKEQAAFTRAWICTGASAVLISASVILFVRSSKPEKKSAVLLQPIINPKYAGVLVLGSF